MRTLSVFSVLVVVALLGFTDQAHAQFGNAGATVYFGTHTPGVDMPVFGVYNYANRGNQDASSTVSIMGSRTMLPRIYMENVSPSSPNGLQNSNIMNGALMLPVNITDPWPPMFPGAPIAGEPSYTDTRQTRVFGREVYNDMAIIWNLPSYNIVANPFQSYDLLIFVEWPAGVGQAFGTTYPAGSAIIAVRYDTIP